MRVHLGDTVIFRDPSRQSNGSKDHVAIVTRVFSQECVNLHVIPDFGQPYAMGSQQLIDPENQYSTGWFHRDGEDR